MRQKDCHKLFDDDDDDDDINADHDAMTSFAACRGVS